MAYTKVLASIGAESQSMINSNTPASIRRLLKVQFVVAAAVPLVFLLFSSHLALSAAVGAGIFALAQWVFAQHAFRYRGARSAGLIAQSFARGETYKMLLIAGLLAAALTLIDGVKPLALLSGLFAVQAVFWFFPFIDRRRESAAPRD